MMPTAFDIIILGGGLVGLTAANLFAQQGFSVAVVERQKPNLKWANRQDQAQFDFRCSAISRGSQQIFQEVGVWKAIEAERVSPYRRIVVWDAVGFGEIIFDAGEVAEPDLGHIIENRVMLKALWNAALNHPAITFFTSSSPATMEMAIDRQRVILTLEDHTILRATLVVGADGKHSWLRETLKIETLKRDYQQSALVATVTTELPHQDTAWQRFLPEGPLAFLPLPTLNTSSIVWTSEPKKIEALLKMDEQQFCQELAHHFDYQLGKILSAVDRTSFPLEMLHAKQYIQDRAVLIGDAAHVIHPLAGQGLNLGLYDAKKLTETIKHASDNNQDIGNHLVLRKYERSRKGHIIAVIMAMEFLNKMFKAQSSLVLSTRSVAINAVHQSSLFKKKLIKEAMGI